MVDQKLSVSFQTVALVLGVLAAELLDACHRRTK